MTSYPPPPAPSAAQSKPFWKRWWFWAAVAVVIVIIAVSSNSGDKKNNASDSAPLTTTPPSTTSAAPSSQPQTTTAAPPKTTEAPKLMTLLDDKGNGIRDTKSFTVTADEWTVSYSFDCGNFGQAGNFQIYLYDGDDNSISNIIANELEKKGKATQTEHGSGKYYFKINSVCKWKVKVKG